MASYLQIENISKSYGPKVLFDHISFNLNEGDKIALIAPNGTGKTSLLRILAGKDKSDSGGKITFLKDIRIAFLEQDYAFDPEASVLEQVMEGCKGERFEYELKAKQLLTNFGLGDLSVRMKNLSGGEIKRVALSQMLAQDADFYIMDEPTNHLDLDAIEYLESYLTRSRCTLLMVTHDRYFLERVCNIVMELDHGSLYFYRGDYENFLEKRQERIENYNSETDKVRNILRRELEWMRSTPCARSGKAKYRKDAFYELKERAEQVYRSSQLDLSEMTGSTRLGSKVINCRDVCFHYGDKCILDHFTYNFQRYERVGIVGRNGSGKSTFINLLLGLIPDDGVARQSGVIDLGESLKIGYYNQNGIEFDDNQTVLETVNDTHLLGRFLFPHDMYNNRLSKLSGGEKRRLYLLTILMKQPNLLIMDEPTNDLDIVTLNVLEEYLKDFKGTLVIVSHDRHFLDRLVDHLFVFCGDGVVRDFIGTYTEYRTFIKDYESERRSLDRAAKPSEKSRRIQDTQSPVPSKRKMNFKEKREFEQLEIEIEQLSAEKESLTGRMNSGTLPYNELAAVSQRFSEVSDLLDVKEMRWLELSELA
ncbi:MAG: ABC-F family ATP-binding cassette domain-containing protein [Bacteroidales bacterium]|nr:ABC-F family ATP-binding cassette domain-containing protein [Candidatus Cacconaster equi]